MPHPNLELLKLTAEKLRPLLSEIVFVGGCATGLLATDPGAAPVRTTYDVGRTKASRRHVMVWLWRLRRSSGGSGGGITSRAVACYLSPASGRSPAARECFSIRSGCGLPAQDAAHPSISPSRSRVERIARGHSFALQEPAQVHGDPRQTGSQANCGTEKSSPLAREMAGLTRDDKCSG